MTVRLVPAHTTKIFHPIHTIPATKMKGKNGIETHHAATLIFILFIYFAVKDSNINTVIRSARAIRAIQPIIIPANCP